MPGPGEHPPHVPPNASAPGSHARPALQRVPVQVPGPTATGLPVWLSLKRGERAAHAALMMQAKVRFKSGAGSAPVDLAPLRAPPIGQRWVQSFPCVISSVPTVLFPEEELGPMGAEQGERDRALRPETARHSEAVLPADGVGAHPNVSRVRHRAGRGAQSRVKADFSSHRLRVMTGE